MTRSSSSRMLGLLALCVGAPPASPLVWQPPVLGLRSRQTTRVVVGRAAPETPAPRDDRESEVITADDPLVQRVAAEVAELTGGATLDALLNPAKLINVERELVSLRARRDALDGARDEELEKAIAAKEAVAYVEKRAVMRDWLKWLFKGQAYATVAISLLLVYDAVPGTHLDLSVQVLGFWSWWLFIVPSLRSVKPLPAPEKRSLDAAFYATLVSSLLAPFATKDPAAIWWIDAATVGACYAYGYLAPDTPDNVDADDTFDAQAAGGPGAFGQSIWRAARFASKALDFGSGIERGARAAEATGLERALEGAIERKAIADEEVSPPTEDAVVATTKEKSSVA